MVIEKNQKQFYNPLVIRNLTIFVIIFCDVYEGNDDIKHPRTPMCGARRGEWDCGTDLAHRGQGYSNTLELWLK
jgi:hypothetical protein